MRPGRRCGRRPASHPLFPSSVAPPLAPASAAPPASPPSVLRPWLQPPPPRAPCTHTPPPPPPCSFARQSDAETSPDADSPRPCGVALLGALLERAEEAAAGALLALAGALQGQASPGPSDLLLREGCYRAIGEVFVHLRSR